MKYYENILKETISHDILIEKKSIQKYEKNTNRYQINDFIYSNLKNNLRSYQKEALENYIFLNNKENEELIKDMLDKFESKNNHHLFHMATGSGKTMLIASVIIYLYSLGYKKFIFTTNQTNIISKTKLNLLPNLNSSKYEFKNKFIEIEGKKIQIKEVENFSKYGNDIEIIFTTIHDIHNKINESKENSINLNNLKEQKIVILADEAHHFQSESKSKTIKNNNKSWEKSINKILSLHNENKIIDFTATMDLSNNEILKKYKDKLIYDYTLKNFREDGYSKEISLIQDNDKDNRVISAILINQLRYEIGIENSIKVTPKILFKSVGNIDNLEKEKDYVLKLISNLSLKKLKEIINSSKLSYMKKLDSYLDSDSKKNNFINFIKNSFNESSCLIIHSKDKNKEEKLKIANNLDKNENIRMVFAIDMLNEGWDVLSLFDIVKIDEIEKNTIKKSTTSEIQLIGRGARIFPYLWKNSMNQDLDIFKRKFDNDLNNSLRLLEDMNFYSANHNDYINSIKKELINIGLKDENEKIKKIVKVKPKNELNEFAKSLLNRFVYSNKLEEKYTNEKLISEYDINIQLLRDFNIIEENILYETVKIKDCNLEKIYNIEEFIVKYNNQFILNSVINNISYFNMNNIISKYKIISKKELINDIINLKNKISIKLKNKDINDLNYNEKCSIIKSILIELKTQLERKKKVQIGSKTFKNKFKIFDTFKEYSKNEDNVKSFNEKLEYKNLNGRKTFKEFKISNKDLFYYDHISWDSGLELELYNLFDKNLDSNNFLVIRNEVGFKLYNPFTDLNKNKNDIYSIKDKDIFELNGEGFEPDFIILKRGEYNKLFQFFIEIKGEHLMDNKSNKWKELLLKEINNEKSIIEDNIEYKIYGLEFFTDSFIKNDSFKQEYINKLK